VFSNQQIHKRVIFYTCFNLVHMDWKKALTVSTFCTHYNQGISKLYKILDSKQTNNQSILCFNVMNQQLQEPITEHNNKSKKSAMYPTNISEILLLLLVLIQLLLLLIIHKQSQTISRMEKMPSRDILIFRKVQTHT
jgi:hypothetical protein